jgi:hypothetical protein
MPRHGVRPDRKSYNIATFAAAQVVFSCSLVQSVLAITAAFMIVDMCAVRCQAKNESLVSRLLAKMEVCALLPCLIRIAFRCCRLPPKGLLVISWLVARVQGKGLPRDGYTYNAVLKLHSNRGEVPESLSICLSQVRG